MYESCVCKGGTVAKRVEHLTTDRVHLTTDRVHLTTDRVHLTTDRVHLTTDRVHLTTDRVHLTTDRVIRSQFQVHASLCALSLVKFGLRC